MFSSLLLLSLPVAGFAVAFTQLREETRLRRWVESLPFPFSHAVACPFCLCYWLGLLTALLFDPFAAWEVPWRFAENPDWLVGTFSMLAAWFSLGLLANAWRVAYQLIGKDMSLADLQARELREELGVTAPTAVARTVRTRQRGSTRS